MFVNDNNTHLSSFFLFCFSFMKYYTHGTCGKKLRSVTEVVNHLLPEGYTKIESKDKIEKVKHQDFIYKCLCFIKIYKCLCCIL